MRKCGIKTRGCDVEERSLRIPGKGQCDICRRTRVLFRFEQYRRRCVECYGLTGNALATAYSEGEARVAARTKAARKAYPCVGGPLDGLLATTYDFWDKDGMHRHLVDEYTDYNVAHGRTRRHKSPSMIFVYVGCLQPVGKARDR
jgi:hypothetical protein